MEAYRYQLKAYKTPADRTNCPSCGAKKSFVPYTDTYTGELLGEDCGKCNRLDSCGYHLPPREHFARNPEKRTEGHWLPALPSQPEKVKMYIPIRVIEPCLDSGLCQRNSFWHYLNARFGKQAADNAFDTYLLGTSNAFSGGATVFPLFDGAGFASAQIIKVDARTGKTVRFNSGERATTWLHSVLAKNAQGEGGETPHQWLYEYMEKASRFPFCFGLHLALQQPRKTVCLVESAKTAVVCSIEYPQFLWLAVGALSWLNSQRLDALKDRDILLVPDGGAGERDWTEKAAALQGNGFRVEVESLNLPDGDDIADLVFDGQTDETPEPLAETDFAQNTPPAETGAVWEPERFERMEVLDAGTINAANAKNKTRFHLPVKAAYKLPGGEIRLFH